MTYLTSITCSGMSVIHETNLFFIPGCFPLLEELELSYPRIVVILDQSHHQQLLALPKLRKINLSGSFFNRQSIKDLFMTVAQEIATNEPVQVECIKRKDIVCLRIESLTQPCNCKIQQYLNPLSLHLRFEPGMVAYSQCQYPGLAPASIKAIEAAISLVERKPWNGELARIWGQC
ncbi:hypothetical protein TSUD_260940 [Trifolium subterraneum]|uniref:FBD domain-containing protein n=1 Tax=Trifolium subterraneum TaxID=3900 RepID=A0A2Z6LSI1_TRISU|nr:hypothetical protein TSUD_260940 [Trifolium subterraneum]